MQWPAAAAAAAEGQGGRFRIYANGFSVDASRKVKLEFCSKVDCERGEGLEGWFIIIAVDSDYECSVLKLVSH